MQTITRAGNRQNYYKRIKALRSNLQINYVHEIKFSKCLDICAIDNATSPELQLHLHSNFKGSCFGFHYISVMKLVGVVVSLSLPFSVLPMQVVCVAGGVAGSWQQLMKHTYSQFTSSSPQ